MWWLEGLEHVEDADLFGRAGQAIAAADAARADGQAGAHELLEDLGESGLGQLQRPGHAGHGDRLVPGQGHLQRGVERVAPVLLVLTSGACNVQTEGTCCSG